MNLLSICLAAAWVQTPQSLEAEFDTALGAAGLSRETARYDPNLLRFFGGAEFTAPIFQATFENPWRTPYFADVIRRDLATMGGKPSDSLMAGTRLMGFGTRRTLIASPIADLEAESKKPDALKSALDELKSQGALLRADADITSVPMEVQQAAALIIRTSLRSLALRRLAVQKLGDVGAAYKLMAGAPAAGLEGADFDAALQIYRDIDLRYLAAGAHDLFLASQTAKTWVATVPVSAPYDWEAHTSWGVIRLTGGLPTVHGNRPTFLIIDTGGNDGYINVPTNASASNWASVVIDTTGNDRYLSHAELEFKTVAAWEGRKTAKLAPGPAGALLGYSVLIDGDGSDVYRSHRPGLGSGRLGCAMLLDEQGDDAYDAYIDSQGFGMFGAGILEDMTGTDRYEGFSQVQGVGQTMGFGYLVDKVGEDRYLANDKVMDFPSAQSAEHNVSMAQGAGNGRRADYTDGHSLAGGLGILMDQGGKDGYSCGIFGQGVGYWQGVGFLWDLGPEDDIYLGQWYVQGAAAHFAIGYIEDEAGNEVYTAPMNMAQGAGHDFSTGYLLDRAGNDTYKAPNLSLGAGNANGIGVLVDFAGDDAYESSGITLGKAAESAKASLRMRALCLGAFLDLGGTDKYQPTSPWAVNGAKVANWTDQGMSPPESQVGVFFDR